MWKINNLFLLLAVCTALLFTACEEDPEIDDDNEPTVEDLRGQVVEYEALLSYDVNQVDSVMAAIDPILQLLITPQNGIDYLKVNYRTIDAHGNPTIASGAVAIPTGLAAGSKPPVAAYCHGTVVREDNLPTTLSTESNIGIIFGSEGYVVALPDYLGFGANPGLHPYHHADSEASATIDLILAAKNLAEELQSGTNDQLFVFGYSQGGHAAMATIKAIEENYQGQLEVIRGAPMSGAYDLSGIQAVSFEEAIPYPSPYYLPYIMLAYNDVYQLYDHTFEFLKSPYSGTLPGLFDGYHSSGTINDFMTEIPNQIIVDEVLEGFINDPQHPFRLKLRENDLYDWTPTTDMRLYYCEADQQVYYENSIKACETFEANGSTADIQCVSGGEQFGHGDCVIPVLLQARAWFNEVAEIQ